MHNGAMSNFADIKRAIVAELSDAVYARIQGSTDSEYASLLALSHIFPG